jgi:hypothetical protein
MPEGSTVYSGAHGSKRAKPRNLSRAYEACANGCQRTYEKAENRGNANPIRKERSVMPSKQVEQRNAWKDC